MRAGAGATARRCWGWAHPGKSGAGMQGWGHRGGLAGTLNPVAAYRSVMMKLRLVWRDALALLFALRDPRMGMQARALALLALAYALLPLDLLPDLTPLLGAADDLLIVPALLALATRSLPAPVQRGAVARSQAVQRRLPWLVPAGLILTAAALAGAAWGLFRLVGGG